MYFMSECNAEPKILSHRTSVYMGDISDEPKETLDLEGKTILTLQHQS